MADHDSKHNAEDVEGELSVPESENVTRDELIGIFPFFAEARDVGYLDE